MSLIREALEKARREPPAPPASLSGESFRSAPPVHRSRRAPWLLGGAIAAVALLATALGAYWMGRGASRFSDRSSDRQPTAGGLTARTPEVEKGPVKEGPAQGSSSREGDGGAQEGAAPEGAAEGASRISLAEGGAEGASRFSPEHGAARGAPPEGASRSSPGSSPSTAGGSSGADPAPVPAPAVPPRTAAPAAGLPPADPDLRLEGIVGSARDPVAVINGSLVGVGDSVAGYRVRRIDGDEVELARDGRTVVLKLR